MTKMAKLRRHWKAATAIGVFGAILVVIPLSMPPSHWWKKASEAKVVINGQPLPDPKVYRSPDDGLLIDLREQNDGMYVFRPQTQEFGVPNASNFLMLFGYAYSKARRPPLASSAKMEMQPNLIIEQNLVEFTSLNKVRIRVTW